MADSPSTFAYQAQTPDGLRMSGTVEAPDVADAQRRLVDLGLRVSEIAPVVGPAPRAPRAMGASDFVAFNQQLAHLAKAGLPLEHGLRLIATDLHGGGRLGRTVKLVADELERGTPLGEAFDKHRSLFPPLYGRLVAAGVQAGNLPGVLFNLGRHLELVQRLRESLWRALAYPLAILAGLALIMLLIGRHVLPKFEEIYADFHIQLPLVTEMLLKVGRFMPTLALIVLVLAVGGPLLWAFLRVAGRDGHLTDLIARTVPLVGPVIRRSLTARWCDLLRVAIASGMDLPAGIRLASEATGSPALVRDGNRLAEQLEAGRPLEPSRGAMLPASVPATIQFASGFHDLPATLEALGEMCQRQAELRVAAIPAVISPIFVLLIGLLVATLVIGLLAPLIVLIQSLTG